MLADFLHICKHGHILYCYFFFFFCWEGVGVVFGNQEVVEQEELEIGEEAWVETTGINWPLETWYSFLCFISVHWAIFYYCMDIDKLLSKHSQVLSSTRLWAAWEQGLESILVLCLVRSVSSINTDLLVLKPQSLTGPVSFHHKAECLLLIIS